MKKMERHLGRERHRGRWAGGATDALSTHLHVKHSIIQFIWINKLLSVWQIMCKATEVMQQVKNKQTIKQMRLDNPHPPHTHTNLIFHVYYNTFILRILIYGYLTSARQTLCRVCGTEVFPTGIRLQLVLRVILDDRLCMTPPPCLL